MGLRKIIKMFEHGNVSVFGLRGTGKDMLTANVIVRRKKPYISNVDYGGIFYPFEYEKINVGNTYADFINGNVNKYVFPYPDGTDLYISDAGIYFPAQYCNELDRKYKELPTYFALSRQLGLSNCFVNSQALNRVWNKIREQADQFIQCKKCIVLFGGRLVIQRVHIYDRYESAEKGMPRLKLPKPFLEKKEQRLQREISEQMYKAQHGTIKYKWLIYWNKSKYDTRAFKKILEVGK